MKPRIFVYIYYLTCNSKVYLFSGPHFTIVTPSWNHHEKAILTNIEFMSRFKLQNNWVKKSKLNFDMRKQGYLLKVSRIAWILTQLMQ